MSFGFCFTICFDVEILEDANPVLPSQLPSFWNMALFELASCISRSKNEPLIDTRRGHSFTLCKVQYDEFEHYSIYWILACEHLPSTVWTEKAY